MCVFFCLFLGSLEEEKWATDRGLKEFVHGGDENKLPHGSHYKILPGPNIESIDLTIIDDTEGEGEEDEDNDVQYVGGDTEGEEDDDVQYVGGYNNFGFYDISNLNITEIL